jgi:restriction system protein
MARRHGFLEELMPIGFQLPWRPAVLLAACSFLGFHLLAALTSPSGTVTTLQGLGTVSTHGVLHQLAAILQYLAPAGLLLGACRMLLKGSDDDEPAEEAATSRPAAATMTWREFESLVGEVLRRDGFQFTEGDASSPAGGTDLVATKAGGRFVVRCKHWRKQKVGVNFVRELNGVLEAQGARGGIVVTGGQFTYEAQQFARAFRIRLIDGEALHAVIGAADGNVADELDPNAQ